MSYFNGAGPSAGVTAEGGIKYNREETLVGTTPIPKPTVAAGTNYSWPKILALEVTATDTTSISNRKLNVSGAPATGLTLWYKDDAATYNRSTAVAAADNATTNDATPAGYSAMPTSATVYQAGSVSAGSTGKNGDYINVAAGVSVLYVGGAGSAISLPTLTFTYDEA